MSKKILTLGKSNKFNEIVHLSDFSWDCNWYWGGGYLFNKRVHYHFSSYFENNNMNAYDAIIEDFGDNLAIEKDELWLLVELFDKFYKVKNAADAMKRHSYTSKGVAKILIDEELNKALNKKIEDDIIFEIRKYCKMINGKKNHNQ